MTERLIASIEKNTREVLRVTLDDFKGHRLVSLRVWFKTPEGDLRPGKDGVAIRIDKLDALISALVGAHGEANEVGWLQPAIRQAILRRDLQ
jgi:hypothetical protein